MKNRASNTSVNARRRAKQQLRDEVLVSLEAISFVAAQYSSMIDDVDLNRGEAESVLDALRSAADNAMVVAKRVQRMDESEGATLSAMLDFAIDYLWQFVAVLEARNCSFEAAA